MTLARGPLLVATRNRGKLVELREFFGGLGIELVDLATYGLPETAAEDDLEAFDTFEENALAKAAYFNDLTGLATIADDSGLVVPALGGAPGVRSKRYAESSGDDAEVVRANNAKLQRLLAGQTDRSACFVCAAAYVDGANRVVERGEVAGRVTDSPRGVGGFGYDPYFLSDELGMTFAEATLAEKETVSHRARAFQRLVAVLRRSVERG